MKKEDSLKRLEMLQNVLFNNQKVMNKSLESKIIEVLVENRTDDKAKLFGRSEYMTPVLFNGSDELIGKIVKVKIFGSNQNTLFGEIIDQKEIPYCWEDTAGSLYHKSLNEVLDLFKYNYVLMTSSSVKKIQDRILK